jgi:acyl-CoA thioesterase YciA
MTGKLVIQMAAMPRDTNSNGDIFGGWLMSLMDLAAGYIAPKGKSATRAVNNIEFFKAVQVGDLVSCYGYVLLQGRTSVTVHVDVYVNDIIVACGDFVNVALNYNGKPRTIKTK